MIKSKHVNNVFVGVEVRDEVILITQSINKGNARRVEIYLTKYF